MKILLRAMVLVSSILLSAGCAFTQMETARQLDGGEAVVSGSLDWPGVGPVPRVSVNGMYGLGDVGDLSAHVGTTVFSGNAGIGGRFYLSDRLNLSLQADGMTILVDLGIPEVRQREAAIVTLTPRLTTAVRDGELFYGGIQANIFNGVERREGHRRTQFLGGAMGLVGGIDHHRMDSQVGFQAELIVFPLGLDEQATVTMIGDDGTPVVAQLSLGMYFRL